MKARNQKGMHLVYVYSFFFFGFPFWSLSSFPRSLSSTIQDDLVDATEKRVGMIEMMEKN